MSLPRLKAESSSNYQYYTFLNPDTVSQSPSSNTRTVIAVTTAAAAGQLIVLFLDVACCLAIYK
jgi:hypothetical protein